MQPGQSARKMTTMLSEQLRTMKNAFPVAKTVMPFRIDAEGEDLDLPLKRNTKPVADFKKYFFIHQATVQDEK